MTTTQIILDYTALQEEHKNGKLSFEQLKASLKQMYNDALNEGKIVTVVKGNLNVEKGSYASVHASKYEDITPEDIRRVSAQGRQEQCNEAKKNLSPGRDRDVEAADKVREADFAKAEQNKTAYLTSRKKEKDQLKVRREANVVYDSAIKAANKKYDEKVEEIEAVRDKAEDELDAKLKGHLEELERRYQVMNKIYQELLEKERLKRF